MNIFCAHQIIDGVIMSRFIDTLDVRLINERAGMWVLLSSLKYESDSAGVICVPAGYKTDFASVPRIPVIFDALGDLAHAAAVLHDYLYSSCELSRAAADSVLMEAAIVSGVQPWKAYLMWAGVRLFGRTYYRKSEKT